MIEDFKNDQMIEKFGGRFKLTAIVQKRWRELMNGARPMVEPEGRTPMELVAQEILQGKIDIQEVVEEDADE